MLANERLFLHHRDRAGWTDHLPRRCADDRELRIFEVTVRLILIRNRIVECSVLEHLGPDAAVDAAAEVLDELAVDERVDPWAAFFRVDRDADRSLGVFIRLFGMRG